MYVKFEDESGVIILQGEDIYIPNKEDVVTIKENAYFVDYRCLDYDENIIIIYLIE